MKWPRTRCEQASMLQVPSAADKNIPARELKRIAGVPPAMPQCQYRER